MATRWRWPPESWLGNRSSREVNCSSAAAQATRRSISGFGDLVDAQPERQVPSDRHPSDKARRTGTPWRCRACSARACHVGLADDDTAGIHFVEPGDRIQQSRFAATGRPEKNGEIARRDSNRMSRRTCTGHRICSAVEWKFQTCSALHCARRNAPHEVSVPTGNRRPAAAAPSERSQPY